MAPAGCSQNTIRENETPSGHIGRTEQHSRHLKRIVSLSSLTQVIRKFAKQLDEWLKVALHDLPENLRNIKFERKYEFGSRGEGRTFYRQIFYIRC